jgi:proteasome accessory factor B
MDASERIVNLAIHLAAAREPVTAEQVRAEVAGYPAGQDDAAFARMFERDKDELRRAGLVLDVGTGGGGSEAYRLDAQATYAGRLTLDPRETIELRAAGAAALTDPSFPYADDLRYALAKLMAATDSPDFAPAPMLGALTADEDPQAQGEAVARLTGAVVACKRVTFGYTGGGGKRSGRTVEPWGLFARDGRWYLVARDPAAHGTRVFTVSRMAGLNINEVKPKTPDFERPDDFDVLGWMLMPFQYGPRRTPGLLSFSGPTAARAETLAAGQGALERKADGTMLWHVPVAVEALLARWVAEAGPGVAIIEPVAARAALVEGLRRVVALHG